MALEGCVWVLLDISGKDLIRGMLQVLFYRYRVESGWDVKAHLNTLRVDQPLQLAVIHGICYANRSAILFVRSPYFHTSSPEAGP